MRQENVRDGGRGFTLVESITVIVIIAVLGGIALGAGRHALETSRCAQAKAELATLAVALDAYQRIHGDYPPTADGTILLQVLIGRSDPLGAALVARPLIDPAQFAISDARDPFTSLTAQLIDPWGRPYRYAYKSQSPWTNSSYVLWSAGPDGVDAGTLLAGGYPDTTAILNLDNVYANRNGSSN